MERNRYNTSLFYYGVKAKLLELLVITLVPVAVVTGYFTHWIVGLIIFIYAMTLLFRSMAMKFDFKRRSGHILYQGN